MKHQHWADCPLSHTRVEPCCLPWGRALYKSEGTEKQGRKHALWAVAVQFFFPDSPIKSTTLPPLYRVSGGVCREAGVRDAP